MDNSHILLSLHIKFSRIFVQIIMALLYLQEIWFVLLVGCEAFHEGPGYPCCAGCAGPKKI